MIHNLCHCQKIIGGFFKYMFDTMKLKTYYIVKSCVEETKRLGGKKDGSI